MNEMNQAMRAARTFDSRAARLVPAGPADVYRALTDPQQMMTWWGKTEKAQLISCDLDVRYGGQFRLVIRNAAGSEDAVNGAYSEVDPSYRLAFTWSSEKPSDAVVDTRVRIELLDLKDGTTRVVVTQDGCRLPTSSAFTALAGIHAARPRHALRRRMSLPTRRRCRRQSVPAQKISR
ncbi:MAG: SRPBCC domain-containing protein [Rhodospirillales bacterium]